MKTGVYISRIIQNQGVFRKENNVTLGIKIMLKKDEIRKNPGTAPAIRLKGLKLRVPVKGTSSHLKVLYGRYRIP